MKQSILLFSIITIVFYSVRFYRKIYLLLIVGLLNFFWISNCKAQNNSDKPLSASALEEDYNILQKVLPSIHPGLYRYTPKPEMQQAFKILKSQWSKPETEKNTLKQLAQFLEKIKCGHTCINPYNLRDSLKNIIYANSKFIPLYFQIIDKKIIVAASAADSEHIKRGQELISINNIASKTILDSLITAVCSDSRHNLENKYKRLEISSADKFSNFDMLFPLFFPVSNTYLLKLKDNNSKQIIQISVKGISEELRYNILKAKTSKQSNDSNWTCRIDGNVAILKMKDWFTWTYNYDWKQKLSDDFKLINNSNSKYLIIDIRDNVGGDGSVTNELLSYIIKRPVQPNLQYQQIVATKAIDSSLWSYFLPWGDTYKQVIPDSLVKKLPNGYFKLKNETYEDILPNKNSYKGKVFILVNAANSSATFNFVDIVMKEKIATIIGQKTGGNQQGLNSNSFVFLSLPNSKLRIDIPLVFNDPGYKRADGGIIPDFVVRLNQADIKNGVDTDLMYTLRLIHEVKIGSVNK